MPPHHRTWHILICSRRAGMGLSFQAFSLTPRPSPQVPNIHQPLRTPIFNTVSSVPSTCLPHICDFHPLSSRKPEWRLTSKYLKLNIQPQDTKTLPQPSGVRESRLRIQTFHCFLGKGGRKRILSGLLLQGE